MRTTIASGGKRTGTRAVCRATTGTGGRTGTSRRMETPSIANGPSVPFAQLTRLVALAVFSLVVLAGCTGRDAVGIVMNAPLSSNEERTYDEWFQELAGDDGSVEWTALESTSDQAEETAIVEMTLRTAGSGGPIDAVVQFEVNTERQTFRWGYTEVNGTETDGHFGFSKAVMEAQLQTSAADS